MKKAIEFNDVYALTFGLEDEGTEGESALSIGVISQDGPHIIRFNFKYFTDLIGASIDDNHKFKLDGSERRNDSAMEVRAWTKTATAFADWCKAHNVGPASDDFIPALRLALDNFARKVNTAP